eukprot:RCo005457
MEGTGMALTAGNGSGGTSPGAAQALARPAFSQTLLKYSHPIPLADCPPHLRKYVRPDLGVDSVKKLPEFDLRKEAHRTHPEDILHQLFPPMTWEEDGETWVQFLDCEAAGRMDVITLQEQLDLRCQQRNALKAGICAVREDLYQQCFDEVIRQSTMTCAERGVLLARIRDELQMSIEAYKTMFEAACQLSMRQSLLLQSKLALIPQLRQMDEETAMAERQVNELRAKHEAIEKREVERRQADEMKHREEVNFLKKANLQLTNEIKRYMS